MMFQLRPQLELEEAHGLEELVFIFSRQPQQRHVLHALYDFCAFLMQATGRNYFVNPRPSLSPHVHRKPMCSIYHYGEFTRITTDFLVYQDHSQRFSIHRDSSCTIPPQFLGQYATASRSLPRQGFFQHFLEGLSRKLA